MIPLGEKVRSLGQRGRLDAGREVILCEADDIGSGVE